MSKDDDAISRAVDALLWEARYRGGLPNAPNRKRWFLPSGSALDPDMEQAIATYAIPRGDALDVGTGTGEQALALEKLGFRVTATDVSGTALERARRLAAESGASVDFVEDNVLDSKLHGPFELVTDRGCFAILRPDFRARYVASIDRLLAPDGWLLLKTDRRCGQAAREHFRDYAIVVDQESRYHGAAGAAAPACFLALRRQPST